MLSRTLYSKVQATATPSERAAQGLRAGLAHAEHPRQDDGVRLGCDDVPEDGDTDDVDSLKSRSTKGCSSRTTRRHP